MLPAFKTAPGAKRGTINVTCPRSGCHGRFVVAKRWLEGYVSDSGRLYMTASCPYCFKAARRHSDR